MITVHRAHTAPSARPMRRTRQLHGTRFLLATEGALLGGLIALAVVVRAHPGPLPGDLGITLWCQHLVRSSPTATAFIEFFSNATWPLQSFIIGGAVALFFALLRRWLDAILSMGTGLVASATNFVIMEVVQRPRPAAPGLHVNGLVNFFSFPSGHVEHAVAYYGLLLFLTFQVGPQVRGARTWLWLLRAPIILLLVMIVPSRLVSGEHWPSDALGGILWGGFWLVGSMAIYRRAAVHWPRLIPLNESASAAVETSTGTDQAERHKIEHILNRPIILLSALATGIIILMASNSLVPLTDWVINLVYTVGYPGVFGLMILEDVFPPLPSEVIMPLAGFLVAGGKFVVYVVLLVATAGTMTGALVYYELGRRLGKDRFDAFVLRHRRWLFIRKSDLDKAEHWFERHGYIAIVLGRMIPGVRSFISIPAGMTDMPLWRFLLYTMIGSAAWNSLLLGIGWMLGSNWEVVQQYLQVLDYVVIGATVLTVAWFVRRRLAERKNNPAQEDDHVGTRSLG